MAVSDVFRFRLRPKAWQNTKNGPLSAAMLSIGENMVKNLDLWSNHLFVLKKSHPFAHLARLWCPMRLASAVGFGPQPVSRNQKTSTSPKMWRKTSQPGGGFEPSRLEDFFSNERVFLRFTDVYGGFSNQLILFRLRMVRRSSDCARISSMKAVMSSITSFTRMM